MSISATCCYYRYTVHLVTKLIEGYPAFLKDGELYFRKTRKRDQLTEDVCGFSSRCWKEHITGRDGKFLDWPDGLWIGERQIEVQLVRSGTLDPLEYDMDWDDNLLRIKTSCNTEKLIKRIFEATEHVWKEWQKRTLRRRFKREHALFRFNPKPEPAKPKKKRRVRPTENLPAAENADLRADAEAAMKKIMDQPEGGAK